MSVALDLSRSSHSASTVQRLAEIGELLRGVGHALALEARVGLSVTHFRRRFSAILHISPSRYITTIRVNAAIKLLTSTRMLLTEIAHACGFYDQSHFIRTFKRIRRQTPAQYRRAHFD